MEKTVTDQLIRLTKRPPIVKDESDGLSYLLFDELVLKPGISETKVEFRLQGTTHFTMTVQSNLDIGQCLTLQGIQGRMVCTPAFGGPLARTIHR